MMKKVINRQKLFFAVMGTLFLLLAGGVTYAYFQINVHGNENANDIVVNTATLSLVYTDGPSVSMYNALPGDYTQKTVHVTNTGTVGVNYAISLVKYLNQFVNEELALSYTCTSYANYGETSQTISGTCDGINNQPLTTSLEESKELVDSGIFIEPGITHEYTFTFKFLETGSNQNANQRKKFYGTINIEESAEAFTLTMHLLDENNSPISNADVEVHSNKARVGTTDANGIVVIPRLEVGSHTIVAIKNGTQVYNGTFNVASTSNEANVTNNTTINNKKGTSGTEVIIHKSQSTAIALIEIYNKEWYELCSDSSNNLNCKLALNASADTNINFSMISSSTNGQGVYYTTSTESTEGGKRVYYYRGDVNNNNVIFGGFCWKIVRTTETGGTKLIYNGVPSGGSCNKTGTATHIESAAFNSNNNSLAYVGYMYGEERITKSDDITAKTTNVIFSNNATYNSTTDMYELDMNNSYEMIPSNWNSSNASVNYTQVVKKHYTCLDNRTSCKEVYYVNAIYSGDKKVYYQTLSNGETIDDLIDMMLTSSDNSKSSNAKTQIDSWYEENLSSYGSYLEDTIFCNDRSITSYGGWNKDNSNYDGWISFGAKNRNNNLYKPSLVCPNLNDKFTVNYGRGNGDLIYPVGLLTADEMAMAGAKCDTINRSHYLNNGQKQWSLSPYDDLAYSKSGYLWRLSDLGDIGFYPTGKSTGLRPVVSLKPGTMTTGGDGSVGTPYVISTN